jgi:hypothetical protein
VSVQLKCWASYFMFTNASRSISDLTEHIPILCSAFSAKSTRLAAFLMLRQRQHQCRTYIQWSAKYASLVRTSARARGAWLCSTLECLARLQKPALAVRKRWDWSVNSSALLRLVIRAWVGRSNLATVVASRSSAKAHRLGYHTPAPWQPYRTQCAPLLIGRD